ncbi:MAG: hypothetical protein PHV33_07315 [Elusimicrobiales bacterium]|nr:hypothetical protein [Elusimicrobiales bacterium]
MLAVCVLFGLLYLALTVALPVFILIKVVQWIMRLMSGEKKPAPAAGGALRAALDRSQAGAGTGAPAGAAPQSEFASPDREAVFVKLKKEGRLDRLALVYYVEDALKSGMPPAAVAAALRAKGWPEEEIAAVVPG